MDGRRIWDGSVYLVKSPSFLFSGIYSSLYYDVGGDFRAQMLSSPVRKVVSRLVLQACRLVVSEIRLMCKCEGMTSLTACLRKTQDMNAVMLKHPHGSKSPFFLTIPRFVQADMLTCCGSLCVGSQRTDRVFGFGFFLHLGFGNRYSWKLSMCVGACTAKKRTGESVPLVLFPQAKARNEMERRSTGLFCSLVSHTTSTLLNLPTLPYHPTLSDDTRPIFSFVLPIYESQLIHFYKRGGDDDGQDDDYDD